MTFLAKPSSLARKAAKWDRRQTRAKAKAKADRAAADAWSKRSAECCNRDKGRCRVSGVVTVKVGGDPRLIGAAHHRVWRSAGGTDDLENLLWVAEEVHDAIHGHVITVSEREPLMVTPGPLVTPEWTKKLRAWGWSSRSVSSTHT